MKTALFITIALSAPAIFYLLIPYFQTKQFSFIFPRSTQFGLVVGLGAAIIFVFYLLVFKESSNSGYLISAEFTLVWLAISVTTSKFVAIHETNSRVQYFVLFIIGTAFAIGIPDSFTQLTSRTTTILNGKKDIGVVIQFEESFRWRRGYYSRKATIKTSEGVVFTEYGGPRVRDSQQVPIFVSSNGQAFSAHASFFIEDLMSFSLCLTMGFAAVAGLIMSLLGEKKLESFNVKRINFSLSITNLIGTTLILIPLVSLGLMVISVPLYLILCMLPAATFF